MDLGQLAALLGILAAGTGLAFLLGFSTAKKQKEEHYHRINESYRAMIQSHKELMESEAGEAHNAGFNKGYVHGLEHAYATIQKLLDPDHEDLDATAT